MNKLVGKISEVISGTPYSALEIDLSGGGHIAVVERVDSGPCSVFLIPKDTRQWK